MKKNIILVVLVAFFLSACATVYRSPQFYEVRQKHRIVALLPFDVTISSTRLPKGMTIEILKEMEKEEGFGTQALFYSHFLKKSADFSVAFQDVDKTNAILAKNNIYFADLRTYAKEDLARLLGVDAVITGKIQREKPMSEAAAIALGVLVGIWGSTNKVNVDMTIHDGATGELFWKYSHQLSGSIGSSSEQLVKAFSRKIARVFPYLIAR
ncbi:MAG: hypothetical protein NTW38_09775 [Candidatus Aminicenantes bacterium]|nr:hypothetical protein [Candidatus Aminicenantes bacterium]